MGNSAKPLKHVQHAWKRKTVFLGCAVAVIAIASMAAAFRWPVIVQRGNPIPYLLAAGRITGQTPYVPVDVEDGAAVYISRLGPCPELLEHVAESRQLEFQEQGGSGYIFSNGMQTLVVTSEIYFGKYTVWEVPADTVQAGSAPG